MSRADRIGVQPGSRRARQVTGEKPQSAVQVARRGLEGLAEGKHWVIPYLRGRVQVFAPAILPADGGDRCGRADVPAGDPQI